MTATVKIDFVTRDDTNDEFALYIVEVGPWPEDDHAWDERLRALNERILSAADAAIDGGVALEYPESKGRRFRIQVDTPGGTPPQVERLVDAIKRHLVDDPEYSSAIRDSRHVGALRVVTGREMGRFGGA